jgi:hypothetical protein
MSKFKDSKFLVRILSHPNVAWKKIESNKYLIECRDESWLLWPGSKKYRYVNYSLPVSDFYFGSLKLFYQRYILKKLSMPICSGKIWTPIEEENLYDMIQLHQTVAYISEVFERQPNEIALKIGMFCGSHVLGSKFDTRLYEVPVLQVIKLLNSD